MPISKPFPQKLWVIPEPAALKIDWINSNRINNHQHLLWHRKYWMIYPARWEFLINNCRLWKTKSRITWTKWTRRFNVATTRWRPTRMNTMNGWNNGGKKTISRLTEIFPPHWPPKQHKSNIFWKFYRNTGWTKTNQKTRPDHLWSISPNGDRAHHQQNDHAALLLDYIKAARLMTSNSDGASKKDLSTETAFLRFIFFFTFNFHVWPLDHRRSPFESDLNPQPFTIMIRIPFERDRLSHGHLVHPVELAHLVHYWDSRKSIERDQLHALEACSSELRKMAPLVEELVNIPRPDHPLYYLVPNITAMLTDLRREVDSRITTTKQDFSPIPTPFTPYDACGRMRGLHDNYPAPLLRKFVYPRSRSAPPTVDRKRTPQPWFHVSTRNWQSPPSSPDSLQSIHHDRRNWLICQTTFDSSTMVCREEKDFCCFSEPNLRFMLIWVAGAKLRTPNYHFLDGCRLWKLLSARIRCFTTILRCHDMAVSIFYTLQIQELTWPMCDRLWDNKKLFNYGANSKSPNCTIALKHSINWGPPRNRGILTAQVTPLQTCQSPWQVTDTINYTNYVWPSQTPSGSSDNKDSHISTMNSFSVPDNCSNTIFSRDWLPEIWNVMKFLPEPEVHQHNLDGDPMCGQLCRMT